MKYLRAAVGLLLLLGLIFFAITPFKRSQAAVSQTSSSEKLEAAYRANNLGVALLDQYKAKEAAQSFKQALEIKSDLIARINLSIALYYLPDAGGARHEAEKALTQDVTAPQPHYILGLINRGQNKTDAAIAEFRKALTVDPDDVATNINLGQLFVQQKKSADAPAAFRKALAAEPYNETALYNLGLLLTRSGEKEEGRRLIKKFQQLRESGAGTTIGTNYLEGGRYAEAIVSTGTEPELVDRTTPAVRFVDASAQVFPAASPNADRKPVEEKIASSPTVENTWRRHGDCGRSAPLFRFGGAGLTLFDFDDDGDLDLLDLRANEQRLYLNDGGKFVDVTASAGALAAVSPPETISAMAIAGDYDNDGRIDLFILRLEEGVLYHNDGGGKFSERREAGIPAFPNFYSSMAFLDVDHDGDLDIFLAGGMDAKKRRNGLSGRARSI